MNALQRQSREVQIVLAGLVVYLIMSFLDWQQVDTAFGSFGRSEWHGIGVVAGLLAIAFLIWELLRLLDMKVDLGAMLTAGLLSVGFAVVLLVFTVIAFLDKNEARHWPAWIGLVASIVVAVAAWMRGKDEGVEMPDLGSRPSSSGGPGAGTGPSGPTE